MPLATHLLERAPESPLWMAGGLSVRSGQLVAALEARREQLGRYAGENVALIGSTNRELAVALAALDGLAASMLLVPPDSTDEQTLAFCRDAHCGKILRLEAGARAGVDSEPFPLGLDEVAAATTPAAPGAEWAASRETRWIIPTSGTTGTPKLVAHTFASLTRSVKTDKTVGGGIRWGLLYDLHRFAGLQVYLQAFCGGSALVIPDRLHAPSAALAELAAAGCNALSCTPSMWRKLLMDQHLAALDLRLVSMGGEIADDHLLAALKTRFPKARITHIYASTEAGVGFSVTDGWAGFPASYLENPPPGVRLRVDEAGFLHLRPERVSQNYIGRNEALSDAEGWINTGDLVVRAGERYHFLGRANGAINVGGNKVQPHEVERVILGVDGVAEVVVLPKKNPILGALVQARVVPRPGVDPAQLEQAIHAACAAALEDFKRPAIVTLVSSIALNAAGKAQRGN